MSAHARLAPSAASRWMLCPGSVALSEAATEEPAGAAAGRGTVMHAWIEHRLSPGSSSPAEPLDPGEERIVDVAAEVTASMFDGSDRSGLETRVSLEHLGRDCWGTADGFAWSEEGGHLTLLDWKTGFIPVSPVANWQLIAYAEGIRERERLEIEGVTLMIVQPRLSAAVRSWYSPRHQFDAYVEHLAAGVSAVHLLSDVRLPGPTQCGFCPARATCPERSGSLIGRLDDLCDMPGEEVSADEALVVTAQLLAREAKIVADRLPEGSRLWKNPRFKNARVTFTYE